MSKHSFVLSEKLAIYNVLYLKKKNDLAKLEANKKEDNPSFALLMKTYTNLCLLSGRLRGDG